MNSGMIFQDVSNFYSVSEKIKWEKEKEDSNKKTKLIKTLMIFLGIVLVVEGLIYAVLMPCLSPVKITYTGLETFTPQQISNYLRINPKMTWIQFDSAKAAAKLSGNVIIENVSITKHFPDQVVINILERKPVAITLSTINGKTVPVQIDKNGVIFAVGRGMPNKKVPLVTGFTFDTISEGMHLNPKLRPLMEQIAQIEANKPEYFTLISEIRVVAKDYGTFELELYPTNSNVKVLIDRTLNQDTLAYMIVVLDVLNSMNTNISVVDMRYGSISYR